LRIAKRNKTVLPNADSDRICGRGAMKDRLSIDARWLEGGIGTYTRQLLAGLSENENEFDVRAIVRRQDADLVSKWCDQITVVDTRIYTLREQFQIARAASGSDLLHVPHYNAPLMHRGPLMISIHDLIHITDPCYRDTFKAWAYARPVLSLAAQRAAHIVTVSEYSKAQIVERLCVPDTKVTAIHNGVHESFCCVPRADAFHAASPFIGFNSPYLLYVGSLKPYKNISCLLRAFASVRARSRIQQKVLIVGDNSRWKKPLLEQCSSLGLDGAVHFTAGVPAELLPKIYAAADLLVMPSRMEGFGLPVLEAMACGTPVICSHAASLPEVGGDAVLYFDPANHEELASAIEAVLGSQGLRNLLREKGIERAKRFTVKDSVQKHVNLYMRLLGRS
jgi:glycosyltransferase involved in cell wall biosynthesis